MQNSTVSVSILILEPVKSKCTDEERGLEEVEVRKICRVSIVPFSFFLQSTRSNGKY